MRILIVEDDAGIASGLAATLKSAGYAVDICDTLACASAALRTEAFDMALLDLGLPDGDGTELIRVRRDSPSYSNTDSWLPWMTRTSRSCASHRYSRVTAPAGLRSKRRFPSASYSNVAVVPVAVTR